MDVMRKDDRAVKQVSEGHLAVDSTGGTDGQGGHTLAQEQVWHQQQQGQERPCSDRNTKHGEVVCSEEVIRSPVPRSMWFGTVIARGREAPTPPTV